MYFLYILECHDGSYYTGWSTDVAARVREHNEGKMGACYTFLRRPVRLVYTEPYETRLEAMRREGQLKGWSHAKKAALVRGDAEQLKALSRRHR